MFGWLTVAKARHMSAISLTISVDLELLVTASSAPVESQVLMVLMATDRPRHAPRDVAARAHANAGDHLHVRGGNRKHLAVVKLGVGEHVAAATCHSPERRGMLIHDGVWALHIAPRAHLHVRRGNPKHLAVVKLGVGEHVAAAI
jgi:hypothetical protein